MNKMVDAGALSLRAQVGAPEPFVWIDAQGTRLAAMRRGRGTPVICLHAIAHGARDFEAFAERVGDSFEVIAIDWPGQGRSPSDGEKPSAAHYETVLAAAVAALGLDRAILIGNSIGGAAALRFAAAHPESVRALVLCDAGGLLAVTPFLRFLIRRFVAFFRAGEKGRRWFRPAFRFYYHRVLREPAAAAQRDRIIASGYEIAPLLRQAWQGFADKSTDIRHLAPRVACPVWFAWARSDSTIPWSSAKDTAKRFRDWRVTFFRGGHAVFLEDPDRFASEFRAFVAKAVPSGR
jgi:4,5:9,10-diseco-3-hydroxy-5,9,17-trioxoandrosta-1(10),2-diene-4-oate hydrolase